MNLNGDLEDRIVNSFKLYDQAKKNFLNQNEYFLFLENLCSVISNKELLMKLNVKKSWKLEIFVLAI